jgi:hypothetical protein
MEPLANDSGHQDARAELRRFEYLLFLPWALGTLILSIRVIGARLFLVYLYGWGRVQQEQLRFLDMPKNAPWLVSNGDSIEKGHFVHFVISSACWLALFFTTYPLLRLLLPRRR